MEAEQLLSVLEIDEAIPSGFETLDGVVSLVLVPLRSWTF